MSKEKPYTEASKVHELKCHPEPFAAVCNGSKPFEWRKDDRGYAVGDMLWLREWIPPAPIATAHHGVVEDGFGNYTGQYVYRMITYIIREGFGIPQGYCIMGLSAGAVREEVSEELVRAGNAMKEWIDAGVFGHPYEGPKPMALMRTWEKALAAKVEPRDQPQEGEGPQVERCACGEELHSSNETGICWNCRNEGSLP